MRDDDKPKRQLIAELQQLRHELAATQRSLEESQAAATLLELAPLGIHQCDAQGRITFVNRSQEAITGYTAEELLGTFVWDRTGSESERAAQQAEFRRIVAEQPAPTPFLGRNVRKNGEAFDVRVDWNYRRDPQGQVTGFVCIVSDVTAGRRAEQALQRDRDELERRVDQRTAELSGANAELALFRALAESSSQGFGMADLEDRIVYVNPALGRLLGETCPQDAVGRPLADYLSPELLARRAAETLPALERDGHWQGEVPLVSRQGHITPTLQHVFLLRDDRGGVVRHCVIVTDITERKRAEEAVRQSRDELRTIYDGMPEGLLVADLETKQFVRTNAAMGRMLGYSQEELLSRSVMDIHPPESLPEVLQAFDDLVEGRRAIAQDIPVLRRDGTVLYADVSHHEFTYNGRACSAGFFRDVTERRRSQEALRASEENLRTFFNTIGDLLFVIDRQGTVLWANSTASARLGYDEAELVGRCVFSLHPADRCEEAREVFASLVDGRTTDCSVPLATRHGQAIPAETRAVRGRWNGQEVLFAVSKDISRLLASEERFAKAFQCNPLPMAITAADSGEFLEVNEAFLKTLGYTRSELVRSTSLRLGIFTDPARQLAAFEIMRQHGTLRDFEASVRTKDGRVRHGIFAAEVIQLHDQRVLLSVMNDITERQEAIEDLERERRTLEHMLQASDHERQLIAYDIHDGLAQELAGAILQFQVYQHQREGAPDEARKAFDGGMCLLRQAHGETRRLISGVRPPILDESGIMAAISHLVHDPVFDRGPQIDFRSRVTFHRLAPVMENVIYRIVQEGLSNARQHSGTAKILVSLIQRGSRLRIEIRDWGIGFDPQTVQKNRFGLDGMRQRARLLGGGCSVVSRPGAGTRVVVKLPVKERPPDEP